MLTGDRRTGLNRRDFVRAGAAAGLAAMLPGCAKRIPTVAVVGAGLAGLVATWELRKAGLSVRTFEAANRAGGRAWTLRGHFDNDRFVDAGAMGSDRSYTRWVGYCDQFGIELETPSSPRRDSQTYLDGRLLSGSALRDDPALWPLPLTDAEKAKAPSRLLFSELQPIAAEIGAVDNVLDPAWADYDDLSLLEFLRQRGLSDAAIALVERSLNYNSLATVSTLSALRDTARRLQGPPAPVTPVAGHGALPEAMAAQLDDTITYNTSLTAVSTLEDGVRLTFSSGDTQTTYDADYAVLTLPFTALRKVAFEPGLPAERQSMINRLPYTRIAKTFVQARRRFWESGNDFSVLTSDTAFERVFNLSSAEAGEPGLLLNWINGTGLDTFTELDEDEHAALVTEWLESLWPNAADGFEKPITINWAKRYSEGAYAHYAPGQLRSFAVALPQPIGRLHFAGEHTELVAPGIEGAVTSGARAANEILNRLA